MGISADDWIDINESMPAEFKLVLVTGYTLSIKDNSISKGGKDIRLTYWSDCPGADKWNNLPGDFIVTHWADEPEYPKAGE